MSCCCSGFRPASTIGEAHGSIPEKDDDVAVATNTTLMQDPCPQILQAPKPQEPFTPPQEIRKHKFVLSGADGERQRVTGISNSATKYPIDKPIRVHTTPHEERIERLMREEAEFTSLMGKHPRELRF